MSKLHLVEVATSDARQLDLPGHVQLSLTEIAGLANEGLLALAVGTSRCCTRCWSTKSTVSWGRRAATTGSAAPSVTATRRAR